MSSQTGAWQAVLGKATGKKPKEENDPEEGAEEQAAPTQASKVKRVVASKPNT